MKGIFMKKSFLVIGIEENEVKLMEVEFKGKLLDVKRALIFNIKSIDELSSSLMEKIRKDGYKNRTAIVLLPFSRVSNFILSLPPMPKSEIKSIVERELRKNFQSLEDVCYEFFISGTKVEGEEKRKEIVVTYVSKEYIDTIIDSLNRCGITPAIITSAFQAYHNLLIYSKLYKPEKSTAFLDVSETKASIALFRGNTWFLSRDFPIEDFEGMGGLEKLFIELNRAFYYFKQKNRGYEINQLVVGGNNPAIKEIKNYLLENFRIPVYVFDWEFLKEFMFSRSFPPEELDYFANSFFLLVGASLNYFVKDSINFIPPELYEKRMLRYRLKGIGISALAILLIVIFANKYLSSIQSSYNDSLLVQKKYIEKLTSQLREIESTKSERWLAKRRLSVLESSYRYANSFSEFLRELSLITPEEITFEFLECQKMDNGWRFSFDGNITANEPLEAQEIFSIFSEKIKKIKSIKNLNISSLQMRNNPMESNKLTMIFKIQGEIEL